MGTAMVDVDSGRSDDQKGLTSLPAAMSISGSIRFRGVAHNSCERADGWSSPYAAAVRSSRSSSLPPLNRSCDGHGQQPCFLFVKGVFEGECFVYEPLVFFRFLAHVSHFLLGVLKVCIGALAIKKLLLQRHSVCMKTENSPRKPNEKPACLTWMMRSVCVFP